MTGIAEHGDERNLVTPTVHTVELQIRDTAFGRAPRSDAGCSRAASVPGDLSCFSITFSAAPRTLPRCGRAFRPDRFLSNLDEDDLSVGRAS